MRKRSRDNQRAKRRVVIEPAPVRRSPFQAVAYLVDERFMSCEGCGCFTASRIDGHAVCMVCLGPQQRQPAEEPTYETDFGSPPKSAGREIPTTCEE